MATTPHPHPVSEPKLGQSRACRAALKSTFTGKWIHSAEDARELHQINRDLTAEYQPVGSLEADLLNNYALSQHRWERLQSEISDLERLLTHNVGSKEHSRDTKLAVVRQEAPEQLTVLDLRQRYLRQLTRDQFHYAERFQRLQLRRKKEERDAEKWQIEKTKREKAAQPDVWATPYHSPSRRAMEMAGVDNDTGQHYIFQQVEQLRAKAQRLQEREQVIAEKEKALGIHVPPAPPAPTPAKEPHVFAPIHLTQVKQPNKPSDLPLDHDLRRNPLLEGDREPEPDKI